MKTMYWKTTGILVAGTLFALFLGCSSDDGGGANPDPEPENEAPVALFTATPQTGTVGDEITFTDQSGDSDGNIASWSWAFGDGESSTEQNPTYSYSTGGDYTVTLTVTDNDGASSNASIDISINAFEVVWSYSAGANLTPSSPALGDDGTIYFGSQGNELIALNSDGTEKWKFATGDRVRSTPAIGTDGTIYVGSFDNNFYALNGDTGAMNWSFATGGRIFITSAAIGTDGTIFFGSDDNKLYALNPDGTEKWSVDTGAAVRGLPSVNGDGNTVYFGNASGIVYALNSETGAENWQFATGGKIEGQTSLASDGTIYAGSDDGNLYAINPDGTQKWLFATADSNPITGGPAIDGAGNLYFGTKDGAGDTPSLIYSVSSDGSENWVFETGVGTDTLSNLNLSTPTIGADDTIYFGSFNGNMYAFNLDGSLKFTFESDNPDPTNAFDQALWVSPVLDDNGILYFGAATGTFRAVQVSNVGLANSAWPTQGKNLKRTAQ